MGSWGLCSHYLHGGGGNFVWETKGGIRGCLSREERCKIYMTSGSGITFYVPVRFASLFNLYGK